MSKKKKKISVIGEIDKTLDNTYENIRDEIEDIQLELYIAEKKAQKKARKKLHKDSNYFDATTERLKARQQIIQKIEGENLLERIERSFKDLVPVVITIARLIASLILAILSFEPIKTHIKPTTLARFQAIYEAAMKITK